MTTTELALRLALLAATFPVHWYATVPPMGQTAYKARYGWHETIRWSDHEVHFERETISEAFDVCRQHKWKGYIVWWSAIGIEKDSCLFMKSTRAK